MMHMKHVPGAGAHTTWTPMVACSCQLRLPRSTPQNGYGSSRCNASEGTNAQRPIGCSDLYNMTEAISNNMEADQQALQAPKSPLATQQPSNNSSVTEQSVPSNQPVSQSATKPERGVQYYQGLVTTDLQRDNDASAADMLARSLQFAGASAAVLASLTWLFLASNHLV